MARVRAYSKTDTRQYERRKRNASGNAIVGLFIGFFVAYLVSEFILVGQNHLWHWLGAGVGAAIAYFVTLSWLLHWIDAQQSAKQKARR